MTSVVVLAGGKGTRMGGDKPLHAYGQTTLIEATLARLRRQTDDIRINAGSTGKPLGVALARTGVPLIFDGKDYADLGPLSGVLTALDYAAARGHDAVITTPCDMPHLPADMVTQLLAGPAVDIVHFTGSRDYPLCARWDVHIRDRLRIALTTASPFGGLSVMRFLATQRVHKIHTDNDPAFANINSPEQIRDRLFASITHDRVRSCAKLDVAQP